MTLRTTLLCSPRLARRSRLIPNEHKAVVSMAIVEGARTLQQEIHCALSRGGEERPMPAPPLNFQNPLSDGGER